MVNCQICSKYESASVTVNDQMDGFGKGWEVKTTAKINRRMCRIGIKLFNEALKENPTKSPFRPKSFPYVAKMYEKVKFRPTGSVEWLQGTVVDRSIGANQRVMGYEIEVITKAKYTGVLDRKDTYYVNPTNIKPLVSWREKKEALDQKEMHIRSVPNAPPGKYKFKIGGQVDREA